MHPKQLNFQYISIRYFVVVHCQGQGIQNAYDLNKKKKNIFSSFVCANKIALANIAVLNIFYQSIRLFMILSHISLAYLFQKFNFQYHSPRELVSTQNFGNEF